MRTHYIFITGGVFSGLGKGIISSSIGKLLQYQGYAVTSIKIDPYINFDAGTMRPTEHGEVWVTDDGGEIDQDLGNYERFLNIDLNKENNITTGKVYYSVIQRERAGEYLGKTVQPIPHVTNEIKRQIKKRAAESLANFVMVEVGGQVGDYENILYLEAARQMHQEGKNVLFIHIGFLPIPNHLGEMKTKPMQHSVKALQAAGIQPDFIIGRSSKEMDEVRKEKISLFCNVDPEAVISAPDVENIYEVPLILEKQKLTEKILSFFGLKFKPSQDLIKWQEFINKTKNISKKVKIGVIGKYFDTGDFNLVDSYISVIEAIKHAAWHNDASPEIIWLDSKDFEKDKKNLFQLKKLDGVVVPGGFGRSGVEGKILAVQYCRENKIPYLGLCYGLQMAVIEYARNVCGIKKANSLEIDETTEHPVITILPEQANILDKKQYGASMRLGAYTAELKANTKVRNLYMNTEEVSERHRHRYEVNPEYIKQLEDNGLIFSGYSPNRRLMEFLELKNHPFFVATQAHPEFKSRPMRPAPLFNGFLRAALKYSTNYSQSELKKD